MRNITAFITACLIASNACAWSPSQTAQDEPTPYPHKSSKKAPKESSKGKGNAKDSNPQNANEPSEAFKEQVSKWKDQDGNVSVSLVKEEAEKGNVMAEVLMGLWYQSGNGVIEKNPAQALEWLKKAAEQNDPVAQCMIGCSYATGDGATQNLEEGVNWLTKASQNTNSSLISDYKGQPFQETAKRALSDPQLYPYRAKAMAAQMAEKEAKEVSDLDAGKDGGPPTLTVIKLAQGNSSVSMQNDMSVIAGAIMQGVAQVKIKEIRRGEPLQSLVSLQIPAGTKVYPIRIVSSGQGMDQTQDFYFYKDSFGDWAQVPKPAN